ncbi:MAG: STAS domain-containing protein [Peptostreptococcales bacterium]
MSLDIKSYDNEDARKWILEPKGDIDIASATQLKETLGNLLEKKAQDILLDFRQLDYIDSTGLGIIIGAHGKMKESGNRITIINPKANIQKLLVITGLDKIFIDLS